MGSPLELVRGQPPVPPRVLASAILYGLSLGLRSSRQLERACLSSIDFLWLVEKRDIDHSTFCKFRTQFSTEFKGLFRQVGRIAMDMDLMRLNQVSLDGTKVAANSSRHATAKAATLEQRLQGLEEQIERMMTEASAADGRDQPLGGEGTPHRLPRSLADASRRRERLAQALAAGRAWDAAAGRTYRVWPSGRWRRTCRWSIGKIAWRIPRGEAIRPRRWPRRYGRSCR